MITDYYSTTTKTRAKETIKEQDTPQDKERLKITPSFSIWGSSAVLIRRRRCRNSTYANWYWQWDVIAMKGVGEYFDCMKQSFRWSYWHMVEPRFQPCCG
jgi:hypothetical protein